MIRKSHPARPEWAMPEYLEKYRDLIGNTGGNPIEDLMNDHESDIRTNAIRALLCVAVKSQLSLLERLHERGHL
jgi:hypothetical protein